MSSIMMSLSPQDLQTVAATVPAAGVFASKASPTSSTKSRQRRRNKNKGTAAAASSNTAAALTSENSGSHSNNRGGSSKVIKSKVKVNNGTRFLNNPYYSGPEVGRTPLAQKKKKQLVEQEQQQPQVQQQPLVRLVDEHGMPLQPRSSELPPIAPVVMTHAAAAASSSSSYPPLDVEQQQPHVFKNETAFEAEQRLRNSDAAAGAPLQPPQPRNGASAMMYAGQQHGSSPYDFEPTMLNSSGSSSGYMNQSSNSPVPSTIPQPPMMPSAAQRGSAIAMTSPLVSAFALQQQQQQQQQSGDEDSFRSAQQPPPQPVQPKVMQWANESCATTSVANTSFGNGNNNVYSSRQNSLQQQQFSNFDLSFMSEGDSPVPTSLEAMLPTENRPQHSYPPNTSFVVVAFKHELCTYQCGFYVVENDWVVVQADRGEHVGRVRSVSTTQPQFHVPSRILRHANFAEISTVESNRPNEEYAAGRIQQLAGELGLAMRVVDTEFYSDGTKMTIFFAAKNQVDFRELQRTCFREFRRRVWLINMSEVQVRNKSNRNRK